MNLFAYGTLMDINIMQMITGEQSHSVNATLHNYLRKTVRNEVFPAIIQHHNESVDGIIYLDVSENAIERLDKFEGPLYIRTEVLVHNAEVEKINAYSYVLKDTAREYLSELDWSYEHFRKHYHGIYQDTYKDFNKIK